MSEAEDVFNTAVKYRNFEKDIPGLGAHIAINRLWEQTSRSNEAATCLPIIKGKDD